MIAATPSVHAAEAPDYGARLRATRDAMARDGIDAVLLASPENLYYLTGLNHYGYFATTLLVIGRDGPPQVVARAMERPTLHAQVPDCVHLPYGDDAEPLDAVVQALSAVVRPGGTVGVEQDSMYLSVRLWRAIEAALPGISWVDSTGMLASQRAVKSAYEAAQVRTAAAISDRALAAGIAATRAGAGERDLATSIYRELIAAGSDTPAFPPFVRTSENIPQEHVTWRADRTLRPGDRVFFELGAAAARYHAPLSRIIYVAEKPAGVDAAAEIVLAGLHAIQQTLRPGVLAGQVYAAWHAAVAAGLGRDDYHRHHCGYLTGLGFPPSWVGGSRVVGLRRDSEMIVEAGMVFHVMSWLLGQHLPDYGVSDTALVTPDGCELLTSTNRAPFVTPE